MDFQEEIRQILKNYKEIHRKAIIDLFNII